MCGYSYVKVGTVAITRCYNTGTINGSSLAGGIAGYINSHTVQNCYNAGTVEGATNGAIYGDKSGIIQNCYGDTSLSVEKITGTSLQTSLGTEYWVYYPNDTIMGIYYFPQLKCFVADSENPQPEEFEICDSTGKKTEIQIKVIETPEDITLDKNDVSPRYYCSDYFSYNVNDVIKYTVTTNSSKNVSISMLDASSFGLLQYEEGSSIITITATGKYSSASVCFTATSIVTSDEDCNLNVQETVKNVSCYGKSDGSIELTVSGGTEPYSYKWSNTKTGSSIFNISAGIYTVTIYDSLMCMLIKSDTIKSPEEIKVTGELVSPECNSENGSIDLSIEGGEGSYSYLWNDGTTDTIITNKPSGIYTVTVTDESNCSILKSFELNNPNTPTIKIDSVNSSSCATETGSVYLSVEGASEKSTYTWNNNSNGLSITNVGVGNYQFSVIDTNNCKSSISVDVPSVGILQPSISLVTVSENTSNNLIVWQKEETQEIDYYTIYRENYILGQFDSVGSVAYNSLSVFEDEEANSMMRSWRYKMSATDMCGNTTPLSTEHKTIHLQKNLGLNGEVNLTWDDYEGFNFYSYAIFRKSPSAEEANGIEEIVKLPATITKYSDLTPPSDVESYYVGIILPEEIDPTKYLKAESGPFALAISNIAEVENNNTQIVNVLGSDVFVGVTGMTIVVRGESSQAIIIYDVAGRKISGCESSKSEERFVMPTKGVYLVKVGTQYVKVVL